MRKKERERAPELGMKKPNKYHIDKGHRVQDHWLKLFLLLLKENFSAIRWNISLKFYLILNTLKCLSFQCIFSCWFSKNSANHFFPRYKNSLWCKYLVGHCTNIYCLWKSWSQPKMIHFFICLSFLWTLLMFTGIWLASKVNVLPFSRAHVLCISESVIQGKNYHLYLLSLPTRIINHFFLSRLLHLTSQNLSPKYL